VLLVRMTLAPTNSRIDALVEALRALARGDKHQRVNPDDFAGLGDVARAANEVAASLTADEDPNLGPVKSTPRPGGGPQIRIRPKELKPPEPPVAEPRPVAPSRPVSPELESSDVGPVRPMKKPKDSTPPSDAPPPAVAGGANDTDIDGLSKSASSDGAAAASAPPAAIPSRDELEALFSEFVAAKKSHDESVADLELDAFLQTIQGECERLIQAHQCRGVRFEITTQDGEVSLRPRLLR
jgi:hypothetical protein